MGLKPPLFLTLIFPPGPTGGLQGSFEAPLFQPSSFSLSRQYRQFARFTFVTAFPTYVALPNALLFRFPWAALLSVAQLLSQGGLLLSRSIPGALGSLPSAQLFRVGLPLPCGFHTLARAFLSPPSARKGLPPSGLPLANFPTKWRFSSPIWQLRGAFSWGITLPPPRLASGSTTALFKRRATWSSRWFFPPFGRPISSRRLWGTLPLETSTLPTGKLFASTCRPPRSKYRPNPSRGAPFFLRSHFPWTNNDRKAQSKGDNPSY